MATTISGTTITFNDSSTQTTNVPNSTAALSVGAIGTYAYCRYANGGGADRAAGFTIAGSSLVYSASGPVATSSGSGVPSGSWRLMGALHTVTVGKSSLRQDVSVWLRYA